MYRLIPHDFFSIGAAAQGRAGEPVSAGPSNVRSVPAPGVGAWGIRALLALLLVIGASSAPRAHDLPGDVTLQMLARPEGQRLQLLVRAPMVVMQDNDFPLRGPGYLNIPDADPSLRQAAMSWIANDIQVLENGVPLQGQRLAAVLVSLPSDRSLATFDQARAHVLGPKLPPETEIVWQQAMVDLLFEYPIASASSQFALSTRLARLGNRTRTILRFELPDGTVRAFDYHGNPGRVSLDPGRLETARHFLGIGFNRIVDSADHLFFLACLVIPVRRLRPLIATVLAFTLAQLVALFATTFYLQPEALWLPAFVETFVAGAVLYMASENLLGAAARRRWLLAFVVGLVHGLGQSLALRDTLQFAGRHVDVSLLAVDLGAGLAQLMVVCGLFGILRLLYSQLIAQRIGVILLSAFAAHAAWHWVLERGSRLLAYNIRATLPALDAGISMRWGGLTLVVAMLAWLMSMVYAKMAQGGGTERSSS
jgi:hypothetical protein